VDEGRDPTVGEHTRSQRRRRNLLFVRCDGRRTQAKGEEQAEADDNV
jgi:hypothetical protein